MKDFKILTRYLTPSSNLIRYYSDIMKEKLLTSEEELELAILAKNGDIKAKEKIVKANLRFVISVAKFYARENNITFITILSIILYETIGIFS